MKCEFKNEFCVINLTLPINFDKLIDIFNDHFNIKSNNVKEYLFYVSHDKNVIRKLNDQLELEAAIGMHERSREFIVKYDDDLKLSEVCKFDRKNIKDSGFISESSLNSEADNSMNGGFFIPEPDTHLNNPSFFTSQSPQNFGVNFFK